MKYMLLMQFSARTADFPEITSWTPQELQAHIAFMGQLNEEIVRTGEFVEAHGLAGPDTARIVRAGDGGMPVVSEGPFAETKEFLAGFWIVDVAGEERAIELATLASTAPGPGGKPLNMPIEVRPVMSGPPTDL